MKVVVGEMPGIYYKDISSHMKFGRMSCTYSIGIGERGYRKLYISYKLGEEWFDDMEVWKVSAHQDVLRRIYMTGRAVLVREAGKILVKMRGRK